MNPGGGGGGEGRGLLSQQLPPPPSSLCHGSVMARACDPRPVENGSPTHLEPPQNTHRLLDLVGVDVGLHVASNFIESYPDRVYKSHFTLLLNEANRLGEKTGKGVYRFDRNKRGEMDPDIMGFVQESRKRAGQNPNAMVKLTEQEIVETIFYPVVNEVRGDLPAAALALEGAIGFVEFGGNCLLTVFVLFC